MAWDSAFEVAFHPNTIAVVGVSNHPRGTAVGFNGLTTFNNLREMGFKGRIYPVNPNISEVQGIRAYPRVSAVPEPVDLVIVAVPAANVPEVLEDCIVAGALNVHIMSSGFGETGQEKGIKLSEQVREIIHRGKLRTMGPNGMGLQVPRARMTTFNPQTINEGPVAFVSQSGGHISTLLSMAPAHGIGFSKAISVGNALGMDSTDFVEYLGNDPESEIIALYLEGIREGNRLMQLCREINQVKPVIVWKGGMTESGAQAAASHTGSLKGDRQVWEAFFRQTGTIPVRSVDELSDILMTILYLKPPAGFAAAVMGGGGGNSVSIGDICGEEGMRTPPLAPGTMTRLLQFISLVNQGLANPLDVPGVQRDLEMLRQTLEVVTTDPGIDLMILNYHLQFLADEDGQEQLVACISNFVRENPQHKPLIVVLGASPMFRELPPVTDRVTGRLLQSGVPVYSSLSRACRAVLRFTGYHQRTALHQ